MLLEYLPQIKSYLVTFEAGIDLLNLSGWGGGDERYDRSITQPAVACLKGFQDASNIYSYLNYHVNVCNGDDNQKEAIHAIQKFQRECIFILNKLRGFPVNPSFLIPYGYIPMRLPTFTDICITTIPFIDLDCPITWATMTHEIIHGLAKHASTKRTDIYEDELKCDFWATATIGPAYLLSYLILCGLMTGRARFDGYSHPTHPYIEKRINLCTSVLKDFLGYSEGFIDDWMKKAYEYIYKFEPEPGMVEDIKSNERLFESIQMKILNGYNTDQVNEKISEFGFTFKKFRDNKVSGVGKQLVMGKHVSYNSPITVMNGLLYATIRETEIDIYNTKIVESTVKSIKKSPLIQVS